MSADPPSTAPLPLDRIARGPGGLLILLLLTCAATLPGLGSRQLWAPNEPNHAEVAREMVDDGRWLLPHLNGEPYLEKPPLLHWGAALLWQATGSRNEGWARLPSVLGALLGVVAAWGIGRRLFGVVPGWLAGFALASTGGWLWQARWIEPDALLAGLVALSLWLLLEGWTRDARWLAASGLALGLALLTKGPPALLPWFAAALPLWFTASAVPRRSRALGSAALVLGSLLPPLAWVLAARSGAGYDLLAVLQRQVVERGGSGLHHVRPVWYYLETFPLLGLPWIFLLPAGLKFLVPRLFGGDPGDRQGARFLLGWLGLAFIVFSLIPEKRGLYLLPLYPALAVVSARGLEAVRGREMEPRWARISLVLAALVLALPALLLPWVAFREFGSVGPRIWVPALLLGSAALAGLTLGLQRRPVRGWVTLGVLLALAMGGVGWGAPVMDREKGSREAALAFQGRVAEMPPATPWFAYRKSRPAIHFYSRTTLARIPGPEALDRALGTSPEGRLLLLLDAVDQETVASGGRTLRVLHQEEVGERTLVLAVVSRAPSG